MSDWISVRGAREHNLKNIDVQIPRDKLVVITGLSGSGKSTLAFDTIFAEGQRRYVESLSAYARQFLGQLDKPDVDAIDGLSPAIAIDQKGASHNPRSTVGTITEIYDFLRLLFARVGRPHCPICGRPLAKQTPQQMTDAILSLPDGSRILLLAPLVRERKGEHEKVLDDARKAGFVRARINGDVRELDEEITLEKHREHTIEVVVDRLVIREPKEEGRVRVADSVETALKLGGGALLVQVVGGPSSGSGQADELTFSEQYACPVHGPVRLLALEPRDFSFNSPQGACPTCSGLGTVQELDPDLLLDPALSLAAGAVLPWARAAKADRRSYDELLASLAERKGFSVDAPVRELPPDVVTTIVYGSEGEVMPLRFRVRGELRTVQSPFEGVLPTLRRRLGTADEAEREQLAQYMTPRTCPTCGGARLRPELLAVTVAGANIAQVAELPIDQGLRWVNGLLSGKIENVELRIKKEASTGTASVVTSIDAKTSNELSQFSILNSQCDLSSREATIATPILKEIRGRLQFLLDVGLGYLALNRTATTLSGGEAQRIRLATQVGAGLQGVLYILDEPSIGLHPRDHGRLLATLLRLRDIGNSVLVVEHDEETIRAADWIVDIGPGAGENGGELIASGPIDAVMNAPRSITGQFLSGRRHIAVPVQRRVGNGTMLELRGARANNLQSVNVAFPLGTFICVTGVSGGGKSTLVNDTLAARLAQLLYGARERPGEHDALLGVEHLDKAITIDQSAIGRTPRSNPATYTKVFDPIRQLFAATNEAKARGYDAGRFSFNLKGGRCEACNGEGMVQIEMQFLPDLYVPCEVCGGTRYNRETLDVRFRGVNIAEVLDMTVDDAARFFERVPAIGEKLATLLDVGLGYLRLGQPATMLSGGEAQRIKLASELSRRATGRTLYILDEPTTGLHFADVERLLQILQRLVTAGNTVLVIEHNLDVIKSADWLIDMGPEGGGGGGRVVAEGTPEQVAQHPDSRTGPYLRAAFEAD